MEDPHSNILQLTVLACSVKSNTNLLKRVLNDQLLDKQAMPR